MEIKEEIKEHSTKENSGGTSCEKTFYDAKETRAKEIKTNKTAASTATSTVSSVANKNEKKEVDKKKETEATNNEVIDFSQLRHKAAKLWSGLTRKKKAEHLTAEAELEHSTKSKEKSKEKKSEEEFSIDLAAVKTFFKQNARWLVPLFCIIIALSVSIYFRTMPQKLPITDDWAESAVNNFYKNLIADQLNQQYPNLPQQNKAVLLDKEWQKFRQENKERIEKDTAQLSQQFKGQFKDENGTLYLLGIDPYFYYRQTYYVVKNGFPGSAIKDGQPWDYYRLAPVGREAEWNLHHWFGAIFHKFMNFFGNYPLMFTFFFVGTIFSALTVIPAFFIGRILTKSNAGGFFTAFLMATSSFFVARTTGESSDTDVYAVFFPVLIFWLFLEAVEAKNLKRKLLWISLAGASTGIFSFAWTGWWYIAVFTLVTIPLNLLYHFVHNLITNKKNIAATIKSQIKSSATAHSSILIGTYIATMALSVSALTSFEQFKRVLLGPFQFLTLKAVGVYSYWPNIRTTVAELNVVPLSRVIEQLGGKLLFVLAILGIIILFLRNILFFDKKEHGERDLQIPIILSIWFIASLFATTKGMRFILQATPVFSIALGTFLGSSWKYVSSWASKELKINSVITKAIVFALLSLFLIQPAIAGYKQAYQSVPSMNDAWYNTLTKIKNEAPQDAIITSWWDFGHWFKAVADRPVTFDGGTQVGWGAYWVGKSLLTNDERATVGMVRMLNCGQNSAFNALDLILNDTPREIDILNQIIILDKENAQKTLMNNGLTTMQADDILQFTHCDAPVDYYITSEDMVGKAGVWGHFGSWDFKKAVIYQKIRVLERNDAVQYLASEFNFTSEDADKIYAEVKTTPADRWIAPWPGYLASGDNCAKEDTNVLLCELDLSQGGTSAIRIDLNTIDAVFKTTNNDIVRPYSLVYADREGIKEKKFAGKTNPFSAVLIPQGDDFRILLTDPLHAYSTFTKLFFFNGHGMKCFQKFSDVQQFGGGGKITAWVMDYECKQQNKVFFLPVEEVQAAHILISNQDKSDEEALRLITEIKKNITAENFVEYAKKFSQDPGTKEKGGDLGWFKKGIMVPEFEQAAFELKKGEISEIFKTDFGYHIIYLIDKRKR